MDAGSQFSRQCCVDQPMPVDPALASEGVGHDLYAEMSFAARAMAGVALVQM